jgi:hypothetical protein
MSNKPEMLYCDRPFGNKMHVYESDNYYCKKCSNRVECKAMFDKSDRKLNLDNAWLNKLPCITCLVRPMCKFTDRAKQRPEYPPCIVFNPTCLLYIPDPSVAQPTECDGDNPRPALIDDPF